MNPPPLDVLYEDNHLLVVNKPAGLPTMGTPGGRPTLLTLAKQYVKQRYQKPGNVYLGVMSRLDAPVTGVVLLARTSKAAARLTEQFRSHTVEKTYWAVVEGVLEPPAGRLVDWLGHDDRHRRMHIVGPTLPGAKEARLSYRQARSRSRGNCTGWRWNWRPAASIRFGCNWPITAIRSSAIGSMAAGRRFPTASPCTPGGWWFRIRRPTRGWSSRPRCPTPGGVSAFAASFIKPQQVMPWGGLAICHGGVLAGCGFTKGPL